MLWIAALLAAAPADRPAITPVAPQRQAQAMVRMVSAAIVSFDQGASERGEISLRPHQTTVQAGDGATQPARLVEFP